MSDFNVEIKNYQILGLAKLSFPEGLTVIVGNSNNGKTSIFRAIESLIYNKSGNSFVKSGEKYTAVAVKEGSNVVIWKKDVDSVGLYRVNGKTFNKVGRGQLPEVASALGMSEIDVNGEKVRINFLRQMEYPFLLDKNPTQLFEFLSMSNDGNRLNEIFGRMRSDLKVTNSDIDRTVGQIDSYKEIVAREKVILQNYSGIDKLADSVLSYDGEFNSYDELVDEYNRLKGMRDKLLSLRDSVRSLKDKKLDLDKSFSPLESLVSDYSSMVSSYKSLALSKSSLVKIKSSVSNLKSSVASYESVLSSISIDDIKSSVVSYSSLVSDYSSITRMHSDISTLSSTLSSLSSSKASVEKELSVFKVCPLCGHLL